MIEVLDELTTLFHVLMNIESYLDSGYYDPNALLNFYNVDGSFIGIVPLSRTLSMDSGWYDRFVTVSKHPPLAGLNIYFIT